MDISFIILAWNSERYIEKCLDSYINALCEEKLAGEFFIIDNGSQDGTVEKVNTFAGKFPLSCSLKVIELGRNYGTTISRNKALKQACGEYIVICDSDTELLEGSFCEAMNYLKLNITAGIIAPHLLYEDGTTQPSVKLFPTITDKLLKLSRIFFGIQSKSDFYSQFPWDTVKPVDTVIAAFFMPYF